jgi:hypothetical protein
VTRGFDNATAQKPRFDDHLRGKFYPARLQTQRFERESADGAQPASRITQPKSKNATQKQAEQALQQKPEKPIPTPARTHDARAQTQVSSPHQVAHHRHAIAKITGAIDITHDKITPARRSKTTAQRSSIADGWRINDLRIFCQSDHLASIAAAAVSHDNFARQTQFTIKPDKGSTRIGDSKWQDASLI